MNQIVTKAIVLTRTNFGEADRILTVITPDHGKRRLMAKGVRRERSKLAGGIELFSVSHITYIEGKKEIDTLISTRLIKHHDQIVSDIRRTMLGYELLKKLHKATEDATSEEYFALLEHALAGLDDIKLDRELLDSWFNAQLLKLGGHQPNLITDTQGNKLTADSHYSLDVEHMVFSPNEQGDYGAKHIKLLRFLFNTPDPLRLQNIKDAEEVLPACSQLVNAMLTQFVRI